MEQEVIFKEGGIQDIENGLRQQKGCAVFLITGYHLADDHDKTKEDELAFINNWPNHRYIKKRVNVTMEEIDEVHALFSTTSANVMIAIGGGSVIDLAKGIIYKELQAGNAVPYFIAAPTTAGSGSEATRFAVAYEHKKKLSLENDALLPVRVVLDPLLTYSLNSEQTALPGIDAFCQAIESNWNVHADSQSKKDASAAALLLKNNLPLVVSEPSPALRREVLWAAHLAGRAINRTRTTGPHALSYYLTANHDVPHGQAVALFLPIFFLYNDTVDERNCNHPGGVSAVKTSLNEIYRLLEVSNATEAAVFTRGFIHANGLASELSALGIDKKTIIPFLLDDINAQRFKNNPVLLNKDLLTTLCMEHL